MASITSDPMLNEPGGMATISGHVGQSRNALPAFMAVVEGPLAHAAKASPITTPMTIRFIKTPYDLSPMPYH